MPGLGTFNLTAFWRAMGIKNPHPTMFETIQPVLSVGDMAGLTPQHVPPTDVFGRDIGAVAGQYAIVQIQSRDPGGVWLQAIHATAQVPRFGLIPAIVAGLATVNGVGPFSSEAPLSTVQAGTAVGSQFSTATDPAFPPQNAVVFGGGVMRLWIPPGKIFAFARTTVNTSLNQWFVMLQAVPASESPAS